MITAKGPRCSRGVLLREFREECRRARMYVGTRGINGAAERVLADARGRVVRKMAGKYRARTLLPHIQTIVKRLKNVERQEVMPG